MMFFRLLNRPEGDHGCLPPELGQNVRNGLWLMTLRNRSALIMTTWKYNREWARLGYQKIECPVRNIVSLYGGGVRSLPGATGNCFPGMVTTTPVPLANGPQLGPWRVAVARVEETPQEMLPYQSLPVLKRIGKGRLTCLRLLEMVVQRYWPPPPPPPSWFDELCWPCWPVFTCGEDTGTITAYGSCTD